jgi:hypothetical protein
MSLVSDNPDLEINLTYKGSDDCLAVSVAGVPWMSSMSVMVIKLWPSRIQVWEVNRMTSMWSLYAESTILNSMPEMKEPSGSDTELTPSD